MVVIDDLYKKYKQKSKKANEILAGINLKISEGERIAIVGENGCGKSTLMKTIAGILTPSSGAVIIDNINVHKHRAKIHHFCSFVFGNRPQLEWDVKLKDSLAFSASFYKYSKKNFVKYLAWVQEAFDLKVILNIRVRELSLGQRMRADIARAFLPNLKYLFLDEHTVGIDAQNTKLIDKQLAHECERRRLTLIMTTHDISAIKKNTKILYLLANGKIAQKHTTKELLIDCKFNMNLVFRKRNNKLIKVSETLVNLVNMDVDKNGVCKLSYNSQQLTKSDIFNGLPIAEIDIDSVSWHEFALDDYLETVKQKKTQV